jgi:prevent-host-death family protein
MTVRQISISEFKSHCTEEIREVEKGKVILELTRHGKTVAVVQASNVSPHSPTLEDWVGSGKGTVTFAPSYKPSEPAFDPNDWEN